MASPEYEELAAILRKDSAGEPLSDDERTRLDDYRAKCEEAGQRLRNAKAELRVGDSARARFYRLKDERLGQLGLHRSSLVLQALHVYNQKKRASSDEKPFVDENAETVLRAYSLLRWTMKALDDDEDDEDALEVSRQCFDMMEPFVAAFISRWL